MLLYESMSSICETHKLFDVHSHVLEEHADIPTYRRSNLRLDFMLASHSLQNSIDRCGYNKFNEYWSTDHRAHFADFKITTTIPKITPSNFRAIASNTNDIHLFIKSTSKHLYANKVFEKMKQFIENIPTERAWEPLNVMDDQLGFALDAAERKMRRPKRPT